MVPVLRDNFWLTIHVLTITLSYAAFALVMGFGHILLWRYPGMVCFDVKGMKAEQVVKHLLDQRIVASTTPYRFSYARLACSVVNTPQEVDMVLRSIRDLT